MVAIDDESVAIRCRDSGREVLRRLHFADADTYWMYLDVPAGISTSMVRPLVLPMVKPSLAWIARRLGACQLALLAALGTCML